MPVSSFSCLSAQATPAGSGLSSGMVRADVQVPAIAATSGGWAVACHWFARCQLQGTEQLFLIRLKKAPLLLFFDVLSQVVLNFVKLFF